MKKKLIKNTNANDNFGLFDENIIRKYQNKKLRSHQKIFKIKNIWCLG